MQAQKTVLPSKRFFTLKRCGKNGVAPGTAVDIIFVGGFDPTLRNLIYFIFRALVDYSYDSKN